MKCSGIREYDGAVELMELPDPVISGPGEALIEVHASGVGNRWRSRADFAPRYGQFVAATDQIVGFSPRRSTLS